MKARFLVLAMSLLAVSAYAKDIKTLVVTTTPQMHCNACETRIKKNIRFEKGVKEIATSIPDQTVTITYDADKNTADKLIESFGKFGYKAVAVKPGEKVQKHEGEKCDLM